MKAKSFLETSSLECLTLYPSIIENGRSLMQSSELLAASGKFGVARSLLILGIEEWIKGTILLLKGHGVRITEIDQLKWTLTGNHKTRHESAALFQLLNLIATIPQQFSVKNFLQELNNLAAGKSDFGDFFNSILPISNLDHIDWWSNADEFKNRGFYVDLKKRLLHPDEITREQFEHSKSVAENTLKSLKFVHEKIVDNKNNTDFVKMINEGLGLYSKKSRFVTQAKYERETIPWAEYTPTGATKLLLGTFPTKKSNRSFEFFYPNKSNRFWKILSILADLPLVHFSNDEAVDERKRILDKLRLGICDTGHKILRQKESSLDGNLFPIEFTNVFAILERCETIQTVILTSSTKGNSALSWFAAYCELNGVKLAVPKGALPRTSEINVVGRLVKVIAINSPSRAATIKDDEILKMYSSVIGI
jgi:AbiV family abortive infection protein